MDSDSSGAARPGNPWAKPIPSRVWCCIPSVAILRRDAALGESQDEMHREPTRLPFGLVRSRDHELLTCSTFLVFLLYQIIIQDTTMAQA